jgi:putative ABC transport system ATP-binding protein
VLCNGGPGCCDYLAPVAAILDNIAQVIRQFFQLLPTLTLLENVMLPMELAQRFTPRERHTRA